MLRSVKQPFIHSLYIFYLNTLQIGIDQNGSRIIADHAATVSRTRPFGKETTFLVSIDQSFLNFPVYRRIHQIKERKQTTECIPETRIGVHIAGKHFPHYRGCSEWEHPACPTRKKHGGKAASGTGRNRKCGIGRGFRPPLQSCPTHCSKHHVLSAPACQNCPYPNSSKFRSACS